MRNSIILCGALFSLAAAPTGVRAQTQAYLVRQAASPCLNVRSSPDPNANIVDCLAPGTRVEAIGSAPYWRQIRFADGTPGWAAKKFLEPESVPAAPPGLTPGSPTERDDAWLEVHIVDVGQGDAIWIRTFDDGIQGNGRYEGRNIIIDGGPDRSDAGNELLTYMLARAHEGAIVDALILTHPHNDHYPGAIGILNHFDVRHYYDPGYPKDGPDYNNFRALVSAERVEGQPIQQHVGGLGQLGTPDWGTELEARFLYSYPGSSQGLGSQNTLENNASIVLRLRYGDVSFLFMGDAEGKERNDPPDAPRYVEAILLQSPGAAALQSTVLKLAHHGSETSSTTPFIQAVNPRYVVASSGRRIFGTRFLPDLTTLQRYCAHNAAIRIFRTDRDDEAEGRSTQTDQDGDHVVFRTNGRAIHVAALSNGHEVTPTSCSP